MEALNNIVNRRKGINNAQRQRKQRLRKVWEASMELHGLSYPTWLEEQLDRNSNESDYLRRRAWHDGRRIEAFREYIYDFETGMRIVEKCAKGTVGLNTSIPPMKKEDDKEAVVAAVVSLYRMLQDAKERVDRMSDAEKELIEKHKENIRDRLDVGEALKRT